jgi:hypothetical protein
MEILATFRTLGLVSLAATSSLGAADIPADIDSWLKSYAASTSTADPKPAQYYADTTAIAEGAVGTEPATAILFTLEGIRGGNDYLQFMGLFWNRPDHHEFCCVARVGGKGIGNVDSLKIEGGLIRLSGLLFIKGVDAMCCPSKPYVTDMTVAESKLVVLSRTSNNRIERTHAP